MIAAIIAGLLSLTTPAMAQSGSGMPVRLTTSSAHVGVVDQGNPGSSGAPWFVTCVSGCSGAAAGGATYVLSTAPLSVSISSGNPSNPFYIQSVSTMAVHDVQNSTVTIQQLVDLFVVLRGTQPVHDVQNSTVTANLTIQDVGGNPTAVGWTVGGGSMPVVIQAGTVTANVNITQQGGNTIAQYNGATPILVYDDRIRVLLEQQVIISKQINEILTYLLDAAGRGYGRDLQQEK